jgi:hypothetical protein
MLIADSVLLFIMVCVSVYGATVLPSGSRIPVHFGPAGYNQWVPRNVGLVMWPGIGMVILVTLLVTGHSHPVVGLTIAFVVMLVAQVGALTVAIRRRG